MKEKITEAKNRPVDSNQFIRIENRSDNDNILVGLDNKSNSSDEIKIVRKKIPQLHTASYNDKRNAIKKEKNKLFKSFQSQDKMEVAEPLPKQSPKVNNYVDLSRRQSFAKPSQFMNLRDRNKSASALLKTDQHKPVRNSQYSAKTIISEEKINKTSKEVVEKPQIKIDTQNITEKPSRLVSINVSNACNKNVLKVYEKTTININNSQKSENLCPNYHFQQNLNKNNNIFAIFDIREEYLLSLASNDPHTRNSFAPFFDSKYSVDMDYSHSIIKPRFSSIAKPLTIIDSNLIRPSGF